RVHRRRLQSRRRRRHLHGHSGCRSHLLPRRSRKGLKKELTPDLFRERATMGPAVAMRVGSVLFAAGVLLASPDFAIAQRRPPPPPPVSVPPPIAPMPGPA